MAEEEPLSSDEMIKQARQDLSRHETDYREHPSDAMSELEGDPPLEDGESEDPMPRPQSGVRRRPGPRIGSAPRTRDDRPAGSQAIAVVAGLVVLIIGIAVFVAIAASSQ